MVPPLVLADVIEADVLHYPVFTFEPTTIMGFGGQTDI
jgi:hypothetical protein